MTNSSAARTNLTFKDVTINTNEKLGEGSFRECYEGIYIGGHRNQQDAACKRLKPQFVSSNDNEKEIYQSISDQAILMAESWNETCDKNKKILLSQGSFYVSPQDGVQYLVEPLIRDCMKFTSNTGWLASSSSSAGHNADWQLRYMEAFSHFTYHQSGGQLLVSDLQGRYRKDKFKKAKCRFELCSNPAISSRARTYGPTDLGEKGIHAFFANHVCNEFCNPSWSRPNQKLTVKSVAASWFPITRGTSMVSSQMVDPSLWALKNPACFRLGSNGMLELAEEEEKENKFATVANNTNRNSDGDGASKKNNKKSSNKINRNTANAFHNIEVAGDLDAGQVVGEMGDSGSEWSSDSDSDEKNNSGSDWTDDTSEDRDQVNNDNNSNDNNKGYEEFDDDDVAGDSYEIYGDDYGSEYGDAGETTDDFFVGHGIGSDDEKIVGEQSGDEDSDFGDDEVNDDDNTGENKIIFC